MRKKRDQTVTDFNLAEERFVKETHQHSFEALLDRGLLIEVTSWVTRQMTFPGAEEKVTAGFTARLWTLLYTIPEELIHFQTLRGRGHSVLWYAAWVLARAQRYGHDFAVFVLPLPTSTDEEDAKLLRVEVTLRKDGQPYVVVGLADEFPLQ